MDKSEYELDRDRRIEANKRKIAELGLEGAADAIAAPAKPKPSRAKKPKLDELSAETRRSERARKTVNYAEAEARIAREREPVDYSERIKSVTLDQETAEKLRAEMESKRASGVKAGKTRGPVDSGKGVRVQGGKVYDSKHGVTCHWCRQKTLEDHVTCTNPACGSGRRMPFSFCAKCLKNRHGEDADAADASGQWWCPCCRGSCGAGCVICCNCGPCRKKAGLEPTHQVVKLARDAGFGNVHDYLVHLVTGETAEQVSARKLGHSWGAWMKADGSDASEQTGRGCDEDAGAASDGSGSQQQEAAEPDGVEQPQQQQEEEQRQQDGKDCCGKRQRGRDAAAAAGGRRKKAAASREAGGRRKQGKAAAADDAGQLQQQQEQGRDQAADDEQEQQQQQVAGDEEEEEEKEQQQEEVADDVPLLSSQDATLTRKQRIMQQMGLAAVSVRA